MGVRLMVIDNATGPGDLSLGHDEDGAVIRAANVVRRGAAAARRRGVSARRAARGGSQTG